MGKDWMSQGWTFLVVRGVAAVLFGIVAILWPISTALALVVTWGLWAIVDGGITLSQAFGKEAETGRGWLALMGVFAVLAGLAAVFRPGLAAVTLTWLLGIWLIVRAGFEIVTAVTSTRSASRGLLLLGAAMSLVLGILFVANPGTSAVALTAWLGACAVVWGVVLVATAWAARRDQSSAARPSMADA